MFRAKLFDWSLIRVGHEPPVKDVDVAVLAGGADEVVVCRIGVNTVQSNRSIRFFHRLKRKSKLVLSPR